MPVFACQSRARSPWGLARDSLRFGLLRSGLFVGADLRTRGLIRKAMSHGASLDASPGGGRRDGLGQTESAAGKALNITWPGPSAARQPFLTTYCVPGPPGCRDGQASARREIGRCPSTGGNSHWAQDSDTVTLDTGTRSPDVQRSRVMWRRVCTSLGTHGEARGEGSRGDPGDEERDSLGRGQS